jgi:L-lysine 2,3-aminomutase
LRSVAQRGQPVRSAHSATAVRFGSRKKMPACRKDDSAEREAPEPAVVERNAKDGVLEMTVQATRDERPERDRAYGSSALEEIGSRYGVARELIEDIRVAAAVFPFRVNRYVLDELIDWTDVPGDPIFALTFPRRDMLAPSDFAEIRQALRDGVPVAPIAQAILNRLNPHGSNQTRNVPSLGGRRVGGLQHKYDESLLVFPAPAQTCHSFCTFCFRFAQFVPTRAGRFELRDPAVLREYLLAHPEVSDVIYTGGDPFIAASAVLRKFVEPVLSIPTVRSVRFGTKSLAYWPQRFTTDADAGDLLALLREIVATGRHVAVMYNSTHPRELQTPVARSAIARVRDTGAEIRTQTPIMPGINDDADVWRRLWTEQTRLGCVPYYAFMPRDTGSPVFELPIARALRILRVAARDLPGIAKTARGPVMSTSYGKIEVVGETALAGRRAFVLRFVRAAERRWTGETFLAAYDPHATWLDELQPFEGGPFFFEGDSGRTDWAPPSAVFETLSLIS